MLNSHELKALGWNQEDLTRYEDLCDYSQRCGLIYLESREELSWSVNKNLLTVYPKNKLVGIKKIIISNNIKNSNGYELDSEFSKELNFVSMKPDVELIGDGVILPSTNGLIFPFKAVNLSGVNVKVIRIYEDNVSQFFQSNNFDGRSSLTRVGRIIFIIDSYFSKTILRVWLKNPDL